MHIDVIHSHCSLNERNQFNHHIYLFIFYKQTKVIATFSYINNRINLSMQIWTKSQNLICLHEYVTVMSTWNGNYNIDKTFSSECIICAIENEQKNEIWLLVFVLF